MRDSVDSEEPMDAQTDQRPIDDQPDPTWDWWAEIWPAARFCGDYAEVE